MSLIMLAIGGLLALLGVYAMATGFPIIEVERGWSMLISGAVLLSGGLVVAGLGIVVRTLNGLKAGLAAGAPAAAQEAPSSVAPAEPRISPALPAFAVAAPAAAAALAAEQEARPSTLPRVDDLDPFAQRQAPPVEPVSAPEPEPAVPDWREHGFSAFNLEPEAVPAPPADEHETADPHDIPHHDPEPAYHEPEFHEPEPPAPPHAEEFEPESSHVPPGEPAAEPHVPHNAEPESALAEHHEPPAPDHPGEAPSTAPDAPPGNLAVIGRYDSDGTSYVMYSDGSIEAQSGSQVVRFNSMAELKAYIEG